MDGFATNRELGQSCDINSSMAHDQRPNLGLLMRDGLGPRLRMALVDSFKLSLIAGNGVTVQIFLASLYKSSPAEVAFFLSGTEPLEKLLQGFSTIDVSVHEIAPARNPGDPTTGLSSTIDKQLTDLLTHAAEAGSDRGKGPADVADFMKILSNDEATVALLRTDLGLILKSRPA